MITTSSVSTVLAYHSYKVGGVLCKEYQRGNVDEGFCLHAREVVHPERYPFITCAIFDEKGSVIVKIRKNAVVEINKEYSEKRTDAGMEIVHKNGKKVFGYKVVNYQNVAVTEIFADCYDHSGGKVNL